MHPNARRLYVSVVNQRQMHGDLKSAEYFSQGGDWKAILIMHAGVVVPQLWRYPGLCYYVLKYGVWGEALAQRRQGDGAADAGQAARQGGHRDAHSPEALGGERAGRAGMRCIAKLSPPLSGYVRYTASPSAQCQRMRCLHPHKGNEDIDLGFKCGEYVRVSNDVVECAVILSRR